MRLVYQLTLLSFQKKQKTGNKTLRGFCFVLLFWRDDFIDPPKAWILLEEVTVNLNSD